MSDVPAYGALVGLREMTIEVQNPDGSYQDPIPVRGPQSLSPKEQHVTIDLPGADDIEDIYNQLLAINIDAKWGKLDLAALAALTGDSTVLSGSNPNTRQRFTRTTSAQAPFFRLKGRTAYIGQGQPGDYVMTLPKCKLYGDISWVHDQGKYADVTAKFKAIKDGSGNYYTADMNETAAALPTATPSAPSVTGTVPTDAATGISISANITFTFDKNIQFDVDKFKLYRVNSVTDLTEVDCAVSYSSLVATINPDSSLDASQEYVAIASGGIYEFTGTAQLGADEVVNFTTA